MYETVTVEDAIKRGNRMVNYPVLFIMFSIVGSSVFIGNQFNPPGWTIAIAIIACIIVPWIYWSFMITKWRIWAFENVRNVHKLKRKAIDTKLIWPDGSFWEKTEIRSRDDREKLKLLEKKFDQPDILIDDYTVPFETIVRFSKVKSYGAFIFGLALIGAGIYIFDEKNYFFSALSALTACYMVFIGLKNGTNNTPQIIINDEGIQTSKTPFHPWRDIQNEDVITEGSGESAKFYFVYNYPGGKEQLEIAEYDISKGRLEHLLDVYRKRSSKKSMGQ